MSDGDPCYMLPPTHRSTVNPIHKFSQLTKRHPQSTILIPRIAIRVVFRPISYSMAKINENTNNMCFRQCD